MNNLCKDILRWINEFSKAQTLEELDRYRRVTERIMDIYHDENFLTMAEYRELDGHLVTTYYQRYKDICVAEYHKTDAEYLEKLKRRDKDVV